jgi:hypothetical protein
VTKLSGETDFNLRDVVKTLVFFYRNLPMFAL